METPEVWNIFRPFVERFAHSIMNTPCGCDFVVLPVLNYSGELAQSSLDEFNSIFERVPGEVFEQTFGEIPAIARGLYSGAGFDLGSYQFYAQNIAKENTFMVCCSTRVYAWKPGWLKKLVDSRETFGRGIYGTCASREGGRLHVCTRCWGMDSDDFKRYPHQITSRNQGVFVELGDGNLYEWFKSQHLATKIVYQDAVVEVEDYDNGTAIYRRGDQSQLLVKDKHSVIFDEASAEEKERLARMCFSCQP